MQTIRTLVLAIFLTLLGNRGIYAQYHTQKHRAFPPEFNYAQPPPNQYSPYPQQPGYPPTQQFYGIPPVIPPNYPFPNPTHYPNFEPPQQDLSAKSPMIVPPHTFLGRIPGFLALYYEQPDVDHNVTVHSRNVNGTDPMDPEEGEYDADADDYDGSEDEEEEEEDESRDENERSDFNMECEKVPDGKGGDGFEFTCRYAKKGQNISAASKMTSGAKKTTPRPKPKSTPKSTPKPKPAPKAVAKKSVKSKKAPVKKETKKTGGNRKKSVKKKVSKRIDADLSIEDFKEEELQNRLEENIPEQPIDPRLSVDAEGRQVVQFLTENVWSDFYHVDSKNVSSPEVPELRASTPERVFLKCERFNSSSLSGSEKEKKERPSIKLGGLDFACGYVDKTDLKEAMAQGETVEEK